MVIASRKAQSRFSTAILCLFFGLGFTSLSVCKEEPSTLLRKYAGFSNQDISALDRGEPVSKMLKTGTRTVVSPVGAIRVDVTGDVFASKVRDIVRFKRSKEVLAIGKFSSVPVVEDMKNLTLDPAEINALKTCQVGKCKLKMTREMIELLRKEVNWSSPSYQQQANDFYRRVLVDYAKRYLARGNTALAEYVDKKKPVALADLSQALIRDSAYLNAYAPEFANYLGNFPKVSLPKVESFLYWSKEKYAAKPVVSITHVSIYRPMRDPGAVILASKQIYANHYLNASLSVAVLAPLGGDSRRVLLIYLNRSRVDMLGGFLSALKRMMVGRRVRAELEHKLREARARLRA